MPVQIGAIAHPFSNPTALLSDCHRRMEMFIGALRAVSEIIDQPLSESQRAALQSALRYFREAAPKHTADEEQSLFPRLRKIHTAAARDAIEALDTLENEHDQADALHAEVNTLGMKCLEHGPLCAAEAKRFRRAISQLSQIYEEHIRIEDEVVFPAAAGALSAADKNAVAREMAVRRGFQT